MTAVRAIPIVIASVMATAGAEAMASSPGAGVAAAPSAAGTASAPATALRDDPRLDRWRRVFGWGLLLLVIFVTAAAAIIVFSRRFLSYLRAGEETPPTDSDDVWVMHKLPEDGVPPHHERDVDDDDAHAT